MFISIDFDLARSNHLTGQDTSRCVKHWKDSAVLLITASCGTNEIFDENAFSERTRSLTEPFIERNQKLLVLSERN